MLTGKANCIMRYQICMKRKGDYKLKKEFWLFGDSAAKNEDQ